MVPGNIGHFFRPWRNLRRSTFWDIFGTFFSPEIVQRRCGKISSNLIDREASLVTEGSIGSAGSILIFQEKF